ncbi:Uncharacterised protein [uncultured archaeon]|nr:Uncharacterised protein [uncultured archaeon]
MVDTYLNTGEIKQIKKELLDKVTAIEETTLDKCSVEDIRNMLYKGIKDASLSNTYLSKIKEIRENWTKKEKEEEKRLETTKKYPQYSKELARVYVEESLKRADFPELLQRDVIKAVDEFINETIEPIFKLMKEYDILNNTASSTQSITSIDNFLQEAETEILGLDEFRGDLKKQEYVDKLKDNYIKQKLEAYKNYRELAEGISRKKLLSDEVLRDKIKDATTYVKADELLKRATDEIGSKLAAAKIEAGKANEEYENLTEKRDNLNGIFNAEDDILTGEFNELVCEYGNARLSQGGNGRVEEIKKENDIYKKIRNSLAKKEISENKMDLDGNIVEIGSLYSSITGAVSAGALRKSEANKVLEKIKTRIEPAKDRVDEKLGNDLTMIYRNVLAKSKFDKTSLEDGEEFDYMIFNGDNKLKDTWEEEGYENFHAETSLLRYYDDFVGKAEDVDVGPGICGRAKEIGSGIKGAIKRAFGKSHTQYVAPHKTERKRKPKIDIKKLESEIVRKHKYATYHDLEEIPESKLIEIDDVIKLALGLAVRKNKLSDVEAKAEAIKALDPDSMSNIGALFNTYMSAAKLGERINCDAENLTEIRDGQFYRIDDHINKKAGITYQIKDSAVDWANRMFEMAGFERRLGPREEEDWSIFDTAIKPNKYAPVVVGLGALAALIGGYGYLHKRVTGKELDTEKSPTFSIYEFLENVFIAVGAAKLVKDSEVKPKRVRGVAPKKKTAETVTVKKEETVEPKVIEKHESKPEAGKKEIKIPKGGKIKDRGNMVCIQGGDHDVCIPKENLSEKTKEEHGIK